MNSDTGAVEGEVKGTLFLLWLREEEVRTEMWEMVESPVDWGRWNIIVKEKKNHFKGTHAVMGWRHWKIGTKSLREAGCGKVKGVKLRWQGEH